MVSSMGGSSVQIDRARHRGRWVVARVVYADVSRSAASSNAGAADRPHARGLTMPEHPNATLARQLLDAMNRGDMQTVDGLMSDDIVWHEVGRSEPRRGKADLRAAVAEGAADYTITATVHDVVANDEHTIGLVEATATRSGRTFTYRTAEILHIRGGKVVERWAFSDDTAAIAAFFA